MVMGEQPSVSRVPRSKDEAMRFYDRISGSYDFLEGGFERSHADRLVAELGLVEGETVLEIGFGTGRSLRTLACHVGREGFTTGIDISIGMVREAERRLQREKSTNPTSLLVGDGAALPYREESFDAVLMSFCLELFDTPDIPRVLMETRRVLKPGGKLGVVSMSKEEGAFIMLSLYEWVHMTWPKYVDCRPIYLEKAMVGAGYEIARRGREKIFRLPMERVVGIKRQAHEAL